MGDTAHVHRYYHFCVFREELCGIRADLRPLSASERDFVTALELTNNRVTNWGLCRCFSDEDCFGGPQAFRDRRDAVKLHHVPTPLQAGMRARTTSRRDDAPGWLQCSVCNLWRRVDGKTLAVWDNCVFFAETVSNGVARLRCERPTLLATMRDRVQRCIAEQETFSFAMLRGICVEKDIAVVFEGSETLARLCACEMFAHSFRRSLPACVSNGMLLHHLNLWNGVRGLVFRCALLVGTATARA